MSMRYVTLPNGRKCGLGFYTKGWRELIAIVRDSPEAPVNGFDHFSEAALRVLTEIRRGMHDRINRHIPGFGKGRKWDQDWQRAVIHTARCANTPRLALGWVPRDLKARLAHRL